MNTFKKLCIENSNNAENLKKIEALANEVLSEMEGQHIESGEVDINKGSVYYRFPQEWIDGSDIQDLYYSADDYFHTEFNMKYRMELRSEIEA